MRAHCIGYDGRDAITVLQMHNTYGELMEEGMLSNLVNDNKFYQQ